MMTSFACLCLYLHSAAQLFLGAHVVVYRSDCRYLPYSMHFSEFMSIFFTRKRTKHENTRSPPFSYDTKMAAEDCSEMHSGSCSQMRSSCRCPITLRSLYITYMHTCSQNEPKMFQTFYKLFSRYDFSSRGMRCLQ